MRLQNISTSLKPKLIKSVVKIQYNQFLSTLEVLTAQKKTDKKYSNLLD